MLKLKLQYSGRQMQRTDSLGKTLMLGKIEGRRRRGPQRMRWLDGITNWHEFEQTLGDSEGQGNMACCSPWGRQESDTTERLNWTELRYGMLYLYLETHQCSHQGLGMGWRGWLQKDSMRGVSGVMELFCIHPDCGGDYTNLHIHENL